MTYNKEIRPLTEKQKLALKNRPKKTEFKLSEIINVNPSIHKDQKVGLTSAIKEFVNNFNFTLRNYEDSQDKPSYTVQFRQLEYKAKLKIRGMAQSLVLVTLLNHAYKFNKLSRQYPLSTLGNAERYEKFEGLKKETVGKLEKILRPLI